MDIHALIHSFLQQQTIVTLPSKDSGHPDEHYIKAGMVPFVRVKNMGGQQTDPALSPPHCAGHQAEQEVYKFHMMKPVAKRAALGAPAFQLSKGTRMHFIEGKGWRDLYEGDIAHYQKETLAETAVREGIEELGLKMEAIVRILDVGPYVFSSSKTGKERHMWMFAAEIPSTDHVLPMAEVAPSTAERGWLSLDEFAVVGRDDHRYILSDIAAKVKASYKE